MKSNLCEIVLVEMPLGIKGEILLGILQYLKQPNERQLCEVIDDKAQHNPTLLDSTQHSQACHEEASHLKVQKMIKSN